MTSRTGQQIITIHISFNIARTKNSKTMKFGQIEEYNTKNIFLGKSYTKCEGEATSRPFYEKSKNQHWAYSGSTIWNVINLFLLYVQVEVYRNILKLRCWPLAFTLYKAFLKKRSLELVSLLHFLHAFWEKAFLTLYSIDWPSFIVWLSLLLEILGSMCIVIILLSSLLRNKIWN